MTNGDAVMANNYFLDEQSRNLLSLLNCNGFDIGSQPLEECRQRLRGCEKIDANEKGVYLGGRLTLTDTEIIACRSFLWV